MSPLQFEDLNPFVRYAHCFDPANEYSRTLRCAYDHRLFYVLRGGFTLRAGQGVFDANEGSLLFLPAGLPYAFEKIKETTYAVGINFDFTRRGAHRTVPIFPSLPEEFREEQCVEPPQDLQELPFRQPLMLHAPLFAESIESMERDYTAATPLYDLRNSARMKLLLVDLYAMLLQPPKHSDTVERIMEYINAHYAEPLSNAAIGSALNFHPNYVNRLLLRTTGMTLHAYLLRTRITRAIHLLQTTSLPTREISEQCGFGDPQQFTKIFRRHTGHTPGEYRKIF
ncbi:MAG: helix-turn-helix transcriptional regulator [Clostridia bacterium]|nr:helix-turn-helix transcriptional regulator [Clostridia bacterium]